MDLSKLDEVIAQYQSEKGALISILHEVQRKEGYVSEEVMGHLSDRLELPLGEVFRVATYFEKAFSLAPQGKHTVKVCQGTACYLKHADQILTEIKEDLGEDGAAADFHLEEVRCLGCCNTAPAVEVNGELHDRESAKKTIIKLKGEK
jgi:NADH:ubiquinone oxidoreductase subunit E